MRKWNCFRKGGAGRERVVRSSCAVSHPTPGFTRSSGSGPIPTMHLVQGDALVHIRVPYADPSSAYSRSEDMVRPRPGAVEVMGDIVVAMAHRGLAVLSDDCKTERRSIGCFAGFV